MEKIIKVIPLIRPNEYNSFSDAIHASKSLNQVRLKSLESINGTKLVSYCYQGNSLYLFFPNNKYLSICVGNNKIDWDVLTLKPLCKGNQVSNGLIFQISDDYRFNWGWEILDQFLNKSIIVSPSDQNLFIFTEDDRVEYMFEAYVEKEGNNKFIFLFEC